VRFAGAPLIEFSHLFNSFQIDTSSSKPHAISRLRKLLGLDRAIILTVLARGWSSLAGLVTIVLIAHTLTSAEQGYYYTFGSLVALQVVFELGFSFVILQMASHECAHLSISENNEISGDPVAHARLASVLQKSVRWYSVAALLMLCVVTPAGLHFFANHSNPGPAVAWRLPWWLVVLAASFAFQIDPVFSFLEGCGYVPQVARTRLWQALLGSGFAWVAMLTHHGLFAPAMTIAGQVLAGSVWLYTRRRLLFPLLVYHTGRDRIRWQQEVWPFQWRIAISWICGYFIFQLFNPILFAYWGPVVAGQMGMSLNISNALMAVSTAWVSTKAAPFGSMIARREYVKLDHLFFRTLIQSLVVCILGAATVWSVVVYLNVHQSRFAHRVIGPLPFGMLLLTMIFNHVVVSEAIYLRAHKQEKFLLNSVLGALFMLFSSFAFGRQFGAIGIIGGYLSGTTLIGLGLGTFTFLRYRRIWHAE
jgi:O-antigen/teichoic acid export membrane protein